MSSVPKGSAIFADEQGHEGAVDSNSKTIQFEFYNRWFVFIASVLVFWMFKSSWAIIKDDVVRIWIGSICFWCVNVAGSKSKIMQFEC